MKFQINKKMLEQAATETKGIYTRGYTEIIYNMETGEIWATYNPSYNRWTDVDTETEIKIMVHRTYNAKELEAKIKNYITYLRKELKEPGATEGLPKRWVNLINKIEL